MGKLSFLEAAYNILKRKNRPLNSGEIASMAISGGLISTRGKTPSATMGAQLYTDIKKLGVKSRFIQLGKNSFGLRE